MGLTNRQKAIVHIAAQELGLDDETYRDVLRAHGGVESSVALDYEGFRSVMRHFEAAGFKKKLRVTSDERRGKKLVTRDSSLVTERAGMASAGQIRKIKALWLTLDSYYKKGKEWKALRGFLKKRFGVSHENFLTHKKASDVIEAIKKIQSRVTSDKKREKARDS